MGHIGNALQSSLFTLVRADVWCVEMRFIYLFVLGEARAEKGVCFKGDGGERKVENKMIIH